MRRPPLAAALVLAAACGASSPELVRRPAERPPALLIADTTVLDVDTGRRLPHRDVLVVGERIATVTAAGAAAPPAGTRIIEGAGATLLPGLIDAHAHLGGGSGPPWLNELPDADANLRSLLYCGVTTVLDAGDLTPDIFRRRERVRDGTLLGPTIYAAGPLVTAPGGHPVPMFRQLLPWWLRWYVIPHMTREIGSPTEARAVADEMADLHADVLKLVVDRVPPGAPRLAPDVLQAAVAEARRRGLRTVAHIGTTEDALDAARAGVAAWMHGVYEERIPDDLVPALAAFHIPMVATLVVFESYTTIGQQARTPTALELETVPRRVLDGFDHIPPGWDHAAFDEALAGLRGLGPAWRDNVRRLHAAGVTILAGSDVQAGVFPGPGLHRELHLLTEAGLTPAEAIRAATADAARFLAGTADPDFGLVAPGKWADLLLVDGDPTADLDALARIRAVAQRGTALERVAVR